MLSDNNINEKAKQQAIWVKLKGTDVESEGHLC